MATLLIKGQVRGGAACLGEHLSNAGNNEHITVLGSVGLANTTDIKAAMHELRAMHGNDKRCFFHSKINVSTDKCDSLTQQDWQQIAAHHARRLGLESNARMLVLHQKKGRSHLHVVYCTRSLNGKLWRDSNIYQRNLGIQFAIAKEDMPHLRLTGQEPGQSSRPDGPRPQRRSKTDTDYARENGRGAQIDADRVVADASAAFQAAQAEPAARRGLRLVEELARRGYAVVEGRRGPGIIHRDDPNVFHSLARRAGLRVGDVRAVLKGIDIAPFDESSKAGANDLRKRQGVDAAQRGLQHDRTRQRRVKRVSGFERAMPSASPLLPSPDRRRKHARERWVAETSLQQAETTVFHLSEHLKSPVYVGRDGIHRARLVTGETLRIEADRVSVHSRPAPSASSPETARAVVAASADKGWTSIHLHGDEAFRTKAAREAARRGMQVADDDLREVWRHERERIETGQRQQAAAARVHAAQAAISATRQRVAQAEKFLSHYGIKPGTTVTLFTAQAAVRADLIQQYGPDLSHVPDAVFEKQTPVMGQRLRAAQDVVRDAPEAQRAQIGDAWMAYDDLFISRRGGKLKDLHDEEVARTTCGQAAPELASSTPEAVYSWLTAQRAAKTAFVAAVAAECNAAGVPVPALPDTYKPSAQPPDLAALAQAKADIMERQRQRDAAAAAAAEKASKPKAWMPEPPRPPGM